MTTAGEHPAANRRQARPSHRPNQTRQPAHLFWAVYAPALYGTTWRAAPDSDAPSTHYRARTTGTCNPRAGECSDHGSPEAHQTARPRPRLGLAGPSAFSWWLFYHSRWNPENRIFRP